MKIDFFKYSATGNDFIIVDNRAHKYDSVSNSTWSQLCHRKFGIGADGVIFLEAMKDVDFHMRYLNADGGEVEMCGNGARSITHFAHFIGVKTEPNYKFTTAKGKYLAQVQGPGLVKVQMTEFFDGDKYFLQDLKISDSCWYLNTGVPHCVFEVNDLQNYPVHETGKLVRYDERFPEGSNANFCQRIRGNIFELRTYERGVEGETLSCGTGAVATAIVVAKKYQIENQVMLKTPGGVLTVSFNSDFSKVYLAGEVKQVFTGSVEVK
jgi:diaminopimelate epimerase